MYLFILTTVLLVCPHRIRLSPNECYEMSCIIRHRTATLWWPATPIRPRDGALLELPGMTISKEGR